MRSWRIQNRLPITIRNDLEKKKHLSPFCNSWCVSIYYEASEGFTRWCFRVRISSCQDKIPKQHIQSINRLSMIVRVSVVLNWTVVVDSD